MPDSGNSATRRDACLLVTESEVGVAMKQGVVANEADPFGDPVPGVQGCEIWVKVDGPPPADPSELKYLATDTRTPYLAEYDGSQAGKPAYYMLRWVSTRGETGPWSQTIAATITH